MKPENILIRQKDDGTVEKAVLCDLGVSRTILTDGQTNLTYVGTDIWMAPEIKSIKLFEMKTRSIFNSKEAFGKYGHPVDVFGFGLVAQWLLTGKLQTAEVISGTFRTNWIY